MPIIAFYFIVNLGYNDNQFSQLYILPGPAIGISFIVTYFFNRTFLNPVTGYFNKLLVEADVSDEEYESTYKKFIAIPHMKALNSLINWTVGFAVVFSPFMSLKDTTAGQKFSMLSIAVLVTLIDSLHTFLSLEYLVQKYINSGAFPVRLSSSSGFKMSLTKKFGISFMLATLTSF